MAVYDIIKKWCSYRNGVTNIHFFGVFNKRTDRTNNLLERYNREFGGKFKSKTPQLPNFVSILRDEADSQVKKKRGLESGHIRAAERAPVEWPDLPQGYEEFCPFLSNYMIKSPVSKCTRSAVKKEREKGDKQSKVVAKKVQYRKYPRKR